MPVRIPNDLPARKTLSEENIFVMTAERAVHQDIRPLRIAVLNLMPTKIVTETQILRLLGNSQGPPVHHHPGLSSAEYDSPQAEGTRLRRPLVHRSPETFHARHEHHFHEN